MTGLQCLHAAVVGGSIAGCACAIALQRAGCRVVVFERTHSDLANRGLGIAIPPVLRQELSAAGYLDEGFAVCHADQRIWVVSETGCGRAGRQLWRQPSQVATANWGLLWQALRRRVPDQTYRQGQPVTDVQPQGDKAVVHTAHGRKETYDLVVGADGYRSLVRPLVAPGHAPRYAGYVLWRASIAPDRLPGAEQTRALLTGAYVTPVFAGGHAVFYLIPAAGSSVTDVDVLVNWALYARPPDMEAMDATMSYPPGAADHALTQHVLGLAEQHLPPLWAEVIGHTDPQAIAVQPVADLELSRCRNGPLLLAGDAGTITRPHTASGAVKALQDALCLEQMLREATDVEDALRAYDAQRRAEGNRLVQLGRRIGRDQVEATPQWTHMTPAGMQEWTHRTLHGQSHYLYSDTTKTGKNEQRNRHGGEQERR